MSKRDRGREAGAGLSAHLPRFPGCSALELRQPVGTTTKSFPMGDRTDKRLKFRTEYWQDGICLYAWEYDQLLYGDPG